MPSALTSSSSELQLSPFANWALIPVEPELTPWLTPRSLKQVLRDAYVVLVKPETHKKLKFVGTGLGVAAVAGAIALLR